MRGTLKRGAATLRYGAHIAAERATHFRPTDPQRVPPSADAIAPEWLTGVLCGAAPGARVENIEVSGGSDGTTTRRVIAVQYNAAGAEAGLPTRLFSKATPQLASRVMLFPIARVESEVEFYRRFRPRLDIEAPVALHAACDRASGRSMILFEDMAAAGTTFLDPSHAVTRAQAEDMVRLIAGYQAAFWESPELAIQANWLPTTLKYQRGCETCVPFAAGSERGIDRAAERLPAELLRRCSELWDAHISSVALNSRAPLTLSHWDMHVGNWYLTPGGRIGLSDWSAKKGHWGGDIAYALTSALSIDNRRAWERDLLGAYRDELLRRGVTNAPGLDELWLEYRRQAFHGFFFWALTLGAGPLQPDMQPSHISLANLERMGQAIVDLESIEALG